MACQGRLWVLKGELALPERGGGRWKEGGSSWVGHAEGWSRATERTDDVQGAGRRPLGMMTLTSVRSLQGLSCLTACGIFLDQGSNLSHLCWQVDSLDHQGSSGALFFKAKHDVMIVRVFAGPVSLIVAKEVWSV